MLAPLISDLLIASLLILLIGWATDALRASTHDGRTSDRPSIVRLLRHGPEPRRCHDSVS